MDLNSSRPQDEQMAAEEISTFVGGLPLAIATIGGYISQSKRSMRDFLGMLKRSSSAWTASAKNPANQYNKPLDSVFDLALSELSANARKLLDILAFLNPDSIPEDIFLRQHANPSLHFLNNKHE